MAYDLRFGTLADYATVTSDGKLTLVGCFDRILVPTEGLAKPLEALAFLVAKLEASTADGSEGDFELQLLDEDEKPVHGKKLDGLVLGWRGPGLTLGVQMVVLLLGMPVPPQHGAYHFVFLVNGTRVPGEIPIHIEAPPAARQL